MLLSDRAERFIPKMMWFTAVNSATTEDGGYDYEVACVATALITSALLDLYDAKGAWSNSDLRKLTSSEKSQLKKQLRKIEAGPTGLYEFMHAPENRKCDCMQYVVTAAEIGTLRLKKMKTKVPKDRCAVCHEALARPKFCGLCREVGYCGPEHAKEHWKAVHKKECTGRKEKK